MENAPWPSIAVASNTTVSLLARLQLLQHPALLALHDPHWLNTSRFNCLYSTKITQKADTNCEQTTSQKKNPPKVAAQATTWISSTLSADSATARLPAWTRRSVASVLAAVAVVDSRYSILDSKTRQAAGSRSRDCRSIAMDPLVLSTI